MYVTVRALDSRLAQRKHRYIRAVGGGISLPIVQSDPVKRATGREPSVTNSPLGAMLDTPSASALMLTVHWCSG